MTHFAHALKEAARNFGHRPLTTLGGIIALGLLLLLLDLFWIMTKTVDNVYADMIADMQMELFVADVLPDDSLPALDAQLKIIPGVQKTVVITKEDAREELRRLTGVDLLADSTLKNPLPRSVLLSFEEGWINSAGLTALEKKLTEMPEIAQVTYSRDWLTSTEATSRQIRRVSFAIGILIAIAALLNSATNIRLMSRTTAIGIRQARLLGAGKIFLSAPYIFEGLFIGAVSAVIGWVALWYFKQSIVVGSIVPVFPPLREIIWFCLIAAAVGGLSGYLGVRKLMR